MSLVKRVRLKLEDYLKLPKMAARDAKTGKEIPDPVPLAPPVGWYKQPSMFDQVRQMVRSEHMRMYAASQGAETFEEASDFDVDDEIFPSSQYEDAADFEPLPDLAEKRQAKFREQYLSKRERKRREREEREWRDEEARASSPSPSPSGGRAAAAAGPGSPAQPGPSAAPPAPSGTVS